MTWTWQTLPRLYGPPEALDAFQAELNLAETNTRRWAGFGDSQETCPGGQGSYYCPELNANLFNKYGIIGETILGPAGYYHTNSPPAHWLLAAHQANTGASDLASDKILPNHGLKRSSSTNGTIFQLQPEHTTGRLYQQKKAFWDITKPLYAEVFLGRFATSTAEASWLYIPNTTSAINYFAATVSSGISSGLSLNQATDEIVSFVIGPLTITADKPFPQIIVRGASGDGVDVVGLRFYQTASTGGITWQHFSAGGYHASSLRTSHANAGAMLNAFGPYSVITWHYGTNDAYSIGRSAATFKTEMQTNISTIRGSSWLNSTDHINLIFLEPIRTGGNNSTDSAFEEYVNMSAEIADEDTEKKTLVVNSRRALYELGWHLTGSPTTFLSDTVHYSEYGAHVLADAQVNAMFSVEAPFDKILHNTSYNSGYRSVFKGAGSRTYTKISDNTQIPQPKEVRVNEDT